MTTKERVYEILEEEELGAGVQISDESSWEDLGMDSLDQVDLIMALEESFAIDIPDEHAEKWETVGDAIAFLEGLEEVV